MPAPFVTDPSRSLIHPSAAPKQDDSSAIHVIETAVKAPPGYYKSVILDVLSILAALGLGYSYHRYLVSGFSLWFSFGLFLILGALWSLQIFLQKRTDRRALVILGEAIAFTAWFIHGTEFWIIASAVAALFFLSLFGYVQGRAELDYTTEIRFFRTTGKALGKLMTGVLLAGIILYLPQVAAGNVFISEPHFEPFYYWAADLFNNFYPGITVTGSFGQFAQGVVLAELQQNPNYQLMKPAVQVSTTMDMVNQLTGNYTANAGIAVTTSTPASHVFYETALNGLRNLRDGIGGWFYFWWAVIAFFFLRIIGVVIVWIAQLASLILYESLLASGFMKTEQHQTVKEVVEY
ncbi:MAG: hypothetical protein KGJ13_01615 [Patescibacteria group bacterium]|nr:hypothetical protein [Patescibacteria group bacterium]